MCLGMNSCCETIPPKSEASAKWTNVLKGLMLAELCIAMCKMFIIGVAEGLIELFLILLLFLAYNQVSFCHCIMYIIFGLYNLIFAIVTIATIIQNGYAMFPTKQDITTFKLDYTTEGVILTYVLIVFYTVAIYLVFQAYKEFKYDSMQGMGGIAGQAANQGQPILGQQYQNSSNGGYGTETQNPYGGSNRSQPANNGRAAFQGQGIRIG